MKFKINDQVIVTSGKDKGRKGTITKVLPAKNEVVVEGANLYTRHVRKMQGKAGEKVRKERPLSTAKIAILNEKGEADRIGYEIRDGIKMRVFKKTQTLVPEQTKKVAVKEEQTTQKEEKVDKKNKKSEQKAKETK